MGKLTLGLDLGTNSIGWAVVENSNGEFKLKEKGVRIFQEGVKIEKGVESSKAAERTGYRSARRLKFRRKLRKIETLKVLSEYGFCPRLTDDDLNKWRYDKVYPENEKFRNWWLTDNQANKVDRDQQRKNPYYFRHLAVTKKLNLSEFNDRQKIGRAFYHMAQRRGFLSNRLEGESDGVVTKQIGEITVAKGNRTLGQYFYEDFYLNNKKIRDQYTHREEHYLEEFNQICEFQGISKEIQEKLYKAIFYQRPLKSQKGLIGKCVFEKNKPRCAVSRPEFEEYRMLCFVNNIKIKTPNDEKLRFLTREERQKVLPLFFRKSKDHFDFEDIAKVLAPKKRYSFYKDRNKRHDDYLFNYSMKTTISACPVSARFRDIFGTEFISENYELVLEESGQLSKKFVDAWHAMFSFDSASKLHEFAQKKLKLSADIAEKFVKIKFKLDFASLSLKAIKKILPFLREGMIYSHAVFLGNIGTVLDQQVASKYSDSDKSEVIAALKDELKRIFRIIDNKNITINVANGFINKIRNHEIVANDIIYESINSELESIHGTRRWERLDESVRNRIITDIDELIADAATSRWSFYPQITKEDMIWQFLKKKYGIVKKENTLFHPSAIDTYKAPQKRKDGKFYLGSPMVSAVRNPMAMRALHQLRKVINELINQDIITPDTAINIEMSRGLLNANERTGLKRWQNDREKDRNEYVKLIQEHFDSNGINSTPSEDEVLKYQLWIEQGEHCIYTGKQIRISDFLGANPKYDIEHTIPRSLSFDNSQANKTLCCAEFNRKVKKNRIPHELTNHEEILVRIEPWQKKIDELNQLIEKCVKSSKGASDKAQKDSAIQKRHKLSYERKYWIDKCRRFTMTDVPEGFKNSQKVDIGIITKYSRLYLKTLFRKVYTVKGSTVADFRRMWGLQDNYAKKERTNHVHHCIDAITMACMTKENYETLAKFYHEWEELYQAKIDDKPKVQKPWKTFTQDIKKVEDEILVSHYTPDNLPKKAKKVLRKRGKKQKDSNGEFIYQKGDSVRGSLHKDTFYGAIERTETNNKTGKEEKVIKYVVRKSLDGLESSALKNIVDDRVREIVTAAREQEKVLKKEIDNLLKQRKKVDGIEEELIDKQIGKLQESITNLYCMPNTNGSPIPIKKVRLYQPTVTNPLHIKKQRDHKQKGRRKEYKESFHVANDGNYLMAIYEGVDKKGAIKRDFELVTNIDAGKKYTIKVGSPELFPLSKEAKGLILPLKSTIKIGTMTILWENNPDEIWNLTTNELKRRLYKVVGLSVQRIKSGQKVYNFGVVVLRFHQEATAVSELKTRDGLFKSGEEYMAQRKLNHNQFNAVIEGVDFKITSLGEIERI